jgi:hypothetical protein
MFEVYQNDFDYQCTACEALWLQQYWKVSLPTDFAALVKARGAHPRRRTVWPEVGAQSVHVIPRQRPRVLSG